MKKFSVTINRTIHQVRTFDIKAENEEQAHVIALDTAYNNEGWDWDGREYDANYEIKLEEVPNDYIDREGNPYDADDDEHCWPAGGGLHKDCEYNADALYAYYTIGDRYKIADYLRSKGFKETLHGADEEVWVKGNTEVTYECYDNGGHLWGYMHTELV